jgi:glutaconate CoA-transferase subunit A
MAEWTSLAEAVAANVRDGDTVAMEGFTHLIPFAAGHEVIRQRRRNLSLIRMTPDVIYDQLIGAGCASALTFSWGGNPGVGSLHRFRDAVENGWPAPLQIEERSHSDLANAYVAGAANLPFAVLRGYAGSDFVKVNDRIRRVTCPFTGEVLAATPAVRPDVAIIHAQKADLKGNVLLWGILGVQKEAVLSARRAIVTVEERVHSLDAPPNACVLPSWVVTAVCEVPRGAAPSYAHGYYERDNVFYQAWDRISRDRSGFAAWIDRFVYGTADFSDYLRLQSDARSQEALS